MTPAEHYAAAREKAGTHWDGCWKAHTTCAYWAGVSDGKNRMLAPVRAAIYDLDNGDNPAGVLDLICDALNGAE